MPKPKPPTDDPNATVPDVPSSALARATSTDESAALAALADAGIVDDADDGLTEVLMSDLKTPLKLFNLKKADGVARIAQDQFLDTIDRAISDALNLVLLDMHKTHLYEVYNGERNVPHCSSFDRVTGIWQVDGWPDRPRGLVRPCKGCPDQAWREVVDKATNKTKRVQPCGEVWNVAAFDLDAQRVCLVRFKKTSLASIRQYVQAHHIGRLPRPGGKRGNIPLCVYRVRMTLQMDKSGNYAVPVIERGAQLSATDIKVMHETAGGVRETFEARMRAADESARGDGGDGDDSGAYGADTSFDTQAMDTENAKQRGSEAFVD